MGHSGQGDHLGIKASSWEATLERAWGRPLKEVTFELRIENVKELSLYNIGGEYLRQNSFGRETLSNIRES